VYQGFSQAKHDVGGSSPILLLSQIPKILLYSKLFKSEPKIKFSLCLPPRLSKNPYDKHTPSPPPQFYNIEPIEICVIILLITPKLMKSGPNLIKFIIKVNNDSYLFFVV